MKKLDPYDGKKGLEELEKALIDFESMDEHEFMDFYTSATNPPEPNNSLKELMTEWD